MLSAAHQSQQPHSPTVALRELKKPVPSPPQRPIPVSTSREVKKIRVLLEEHSADKETKFLIKSSNGFVLTSPVDSENSAFCHEGELRLLCKKQRLYMCCAMAVITASNTKALK